MKWRVVGTLRRFYSAVQCVMSLKRMELEYLLIVRDNITNITELILTCERNMSRSHPFEDSPFSMISKGIQCNVVDGHCVATVTRQITPIYALSLTPDLS